MLFLLLLLLGFLLLEIPSSTTPLSFNYTTFNSTDTTITYQRSSYPSQNRIHLTTGVRNIARATYYKPLPLYYTNNTSTSTNNNNNNNNDTLLTSFYTHFSFIVDSHNRSAYGDGLTFFLAPESSRLIPDNTTKGGTLGLTMDDERFSNKTTNSFVAVEFDIFRNRPIDPYGDHVGIDVDSLVSVRNVTWRSGVREGKTNEAWIRYDAGSKNLSVVFTGFEGNDTIYQGLSHIIDLRDYLPESVIFGFSAATGNSYAAQSILSWSFNSTLQIDKRNGTTIPSPNSSHSGSKKTNLGLIIGTSVGGIVISSGLGFILFLWWRKRNRDGYEGGDDFDTEMDSEFETGTGPKKFSYRELANITKNFATENKLGEGGFGGVYKGFSNDSNSYFAVKRVSSDSRQGKKEYASEVRIISQLRHRNLVQLLGWCHERKELLLVYEYMENGSLDLHLFKEKSLLTWPVRYHIAQGLASALLYLHEEWEQCVIHRDIKTSNIMLDSNFNAKLGDFGLARLVEHEKGSQTTVLAGTMGYMAPECIVKGKASKESDVYSFGIVALEIACGRKSINHKARENQISLVEWVWELYGLGKLLEAADEKLQVDFDEEEMERLMIIGLWCANPQCKARPLIRQVVQVLNCEMGLPVIPLEMPLVNYMVASMARSEEDPMLRDSYIINNNVTLLSNSCTSTYSSKQTPTTSVASTSS